MVVCVECLPADKPWDAVSVTRRSSGVAPRACVRVYARMCWCRRIFTYIHGHSHYAPENKRTRGWCLFFEFFVSRPTFFLFPFIKTEYTVYGHFSKQASNRVSLVS